MEPSPHVADIVQTLTASWVHHLPLMLQYILCQCYEEIEDYSVAYFNPITEFEALYCWTSVKGGACTCFVDAQIPNESMKAHMSPALNLSNVQTQWCTQNTGRNNLLTTARDYHICTTCFLARNQSGYVKSVLLVFQRSWLGFESKEIYIIVSLFRTTSFFTNPHTTISLNVDTFLALHQALNSGKLDKEATLVPDTG